jgi:regulator of replication initiation timing
LTANELGSLQKQLQALNESNEKTKTENEIIALELESIKRGNDFDCANSISQLEKLGSELESLRIQNGSVLLDNDSLKTRLSEFELQNQTLSSISADTQDLQNQLASKEQKVCELQVDLEDRVQKIQELTDSFHKLGSIFSN